MLLAQFKFSFFPGVHIYILILSVYEKIAGVGTENVNMCAFAQNSNNWVIFVFLLM